MKILHINHKYCDFGGGERYLLDLCEALEGEGQSTAVISSAHEDNKRTGRRAEYFVEPSFGLKSGRRMAPRVEEIVRAEAPDIIHLHETLVFMSPYVTRRLSRYAPIVQTLHTAFFFVPREPRYCPVAKSAPIPWAGPAS